MSNEPTTDDLHLPDLSITNFRGIKDLGIPRLGRVTLIAGRNGVGKTTVLDAVRVYAARGRSAILNDLLSQREEFLNALDEDYDPEVIPDIAALFHGREPERGSTISVGPAFGHETLTIQLLPPSVWTQEQPKLFPDLSGDDDVWALKLKFHNTERMLPWIVFDEFQKPQRRHRDFRRIWEQAVDGRLARTNQLSDNRARAIALSEPDRPLEQRRLDRRRRPHHGSFATSAQRDRAYCNRCTNPSDAEEPAGARQSRRTR